MRTAAAVLLALILALPAFAASRSDEPRPSPSGFAAVPYATRSVSVDRALDAVIEERAGERPTASRPIVVVPPPRLIVVPRGSSQPSSHRASGTATGVGSWYCVTGRSRCTAGYGPSCLCAAAGPALRRALGSWRGRYVTVYGNGHNVRVRLIDCNCGPHANLIDLYGSAFTRLRPLSAGTVDVKVTW